MRFHPSPAFKYCSRSSTRSTRRSEAKLERREAVHSRPSVSVHRVPVDSSGVCHQVPTKKLGGHLRTHSTAPSRGRRRTLTNKAREERKKLRRDQRIETRYELCMIGILEEFDFGKVSWQNVIGLKSRLARIREEIDRTIEETKSSRKIM